MKKVYEAPEMEIRWFESENICVVSEEGDANYIPETEGGKDVFGW